MVHLELLVQGTSEYKHSMNLSDEVTTYRPKYLDRNKTTPRKEYSMSHSGVKPVALSNMISTFLIKKV